MALVTKDYKAMKNKRQAPGERYERTGPAIDPEIFRFFNFKKISDETGIQPDKLYNVINKKYASWRAQDKNKIAKALSPAVVAVFAELGFDVTITRKPKEDEGRE